MKNFPSFLQIVYPDIYVPKNFISWGRAADRLSKLPGHALGHLREKYLTSENAFPDSVMQALLTHFLEDENLHCVMRALLLGAAALGDLSVYVAADDQKTAYEIVPRIWRGEELLVANPLAMAVTGSLVITAGADWQSSLLCRLSGSPLFLEENHLQKTIDRPPSPAALRRTATELLKSARETAPNEVMLKKTFIEAMQNAHPGATKASLIDIWISDLVPEECRKPGRRKSSSLHSSN